MLLGAICSTCLTPGALDRDAYTHTHSHNEDCLIKKDNSILFSDFGYFLLTTIEVQACIIQSETISFLIFTLKSRYDENYFLVPILQIWSFGMLPMTHSKCWLLLTPLYVQNGPRDPKIWLKFLHLQKRTSENKFQTIFFCDEWLNGIKY